MVMIKRMLALLGSGTLAILLLRQAETAAQAVRDGVQLCLTSVVPALFPFFAEWRLHISSGWSIMTTVSTFVGPCRDAASSKEEPV